jgi:hypothetical protein
MLRIYSWENVAAACLAGVGCVMYGGPGVLGALVALSWVLLHRWLLQRVPPDAE